MTILHAIVLGLIEGFTEFLPISSTAHLIVAQKLMGLGEVNEFFTTVVQLGAIGGLIWYQRRTLLSLFTTLIQTLQRAQTAPNRGSLIVQDKLVALSLATLPVLATGFLLRHKIADIHNSIPLIAVMSIVIGVVLALAQWYSTAARKAATPTTRHLLIMGMWQIIALLPGASRSGTVIAGGLFAGLSFADALEYSFLLSIPALLAAGGFEILSALKTPPSMEVLALTLLATVIAFLSAIVSIEFLLRSVRKLGFLPFVIYRVIFGIAILLFL